VGGLAVLSALLAGCGGGVDRQANVAAGDYFTAEEFEKLSKEQRDAYCDDLASMKQRFEEQAAQAESEAQTAQGAIPGLEQQLGKIDAQLSSVEGEVRELERQVQEWKTRPRQYTVERGDSLWKISGKERIYGDPVRWPRIYRANRDQIVDPNLIYPGWVLNIPRGMPREHTVAQGEFLSLIASYWEIYGSAQRWPDIYEANKDQISDPDLIFPDQVLRIPR
jgi:nucleoid-associated protein YgaU